MVKCLRGGGRNGPSENSPQRNLGQSSHFPGRFHQGLDPLFASLVVSPQKSRSHKRAYASVVIAVALGDIGASDGVILDNDVGMTGTGKS